MLTHTLLAAALLMCVSGTPVPGDDGDSSLDSNISHEFSASSLEYVYAFFRHGIRSPLYETYPTDPHKPHYHDYFKGLGKLTKTGKQQMYRVGKRLFDIYGKFVNDFSEEKVRVSATESSRTIMTALSVMSGLFPPRELIFENLNWQPIPVWQDTADFDKVYFYNDHDFPNLALKECPKYGKMIQNGYNVVLDKDETDSRQEIYEYIQKNTGRPEVNSINTAYEIYDILEFEKLNGLKLPPWATDPVLNNKPLFPDQLRELMVEWFVDSQWLNRDPEMLSFYSGPLFDSINDKFKDKIEKKENLEKFRFHDTHDDTIYTLRWALGFDDVKIEVEPGDGIAFELHKRKEGALDNYYIQVVYYHSIEDGPKFREVLQLPQCPFPCLYVTFSQLYPGMTPKQWEQKCEKDKPFI